MPQLNPIASKKLITILLKLWFYLIRSKWSHFFYKNDSGNTTVIPVHAGEDISVWLLKKILRDIGISVEKYDNIIKW